jgi:hypothetical protein
LAYWAWKDISAFTYNSTDLKAFIADGFTVKLGAVLDKYKPAGSSWPSALDTGGRTCDPIKVTFKYDGSASGPVAKAAIGTSSTLTLTHATGQSVSGTFLVEDAELGLTPEKDHAWVATFTPSGTVTTDFAE